MWAGVRAGLGVAAGGTGSSPVAGAESDGRIGVDSVGPA
jgi:hypothetical protein